MTIFIKIKNINPPTQKILTDFSAKNKPVFGFFGFFVKNPQKHQKPTFRKKCEKVSFGVSKGRPNNVLFCLPPPT